MTPALTPSEVAATTSVATAETTAVGLADDGTDTQGAIDAVQVAHDTASELVTSLPSSTTKTALTARLTTVHTTIGQAQVALDAVIAATAAVASVETTTDGLADDGTDTQGTLDTAQSAYDTASGLVAALPSSTAKTALTARLTAIQTTVDQAQAALNAVNAATSSVAAAETTANGLADDGTDTQGAIDTAQTAHDAASGLVAALPSITAKTALEARLPAVQNTVDLAQAAIHVVIAATAEVVTSEVIADLLIGDGTDIQANMDAVQLSHRLSSRLVAALPDSTAKTALEARLTAVQTTIDQAQAAIVAVNAATASVVTAERTADGLAGDGTDTQEAINTAQTACDAASHLVVALRNDILKTALDERLGTAQNKITTAYAVNVLVELHNIMVDSLEYDAARLAIDGTATQNAITSVQSDHTTASGFVADLPDGTPKTAFEARLTAVQTRIDQAQDALDFL